jgi:hypothetical protein
MGEFDVHYLVLFEICNNKNQRRKISTEENTQKQLNKTVVN